MAPSRGLAQVHEGVGGEIARDGDVDYGKKVDKGQCGLLSVRHGHAACFGVVLVGVFVK